VQLLLLLSVLVDPHLWPQSLTLVGQKVIATAGRPTVSASVHPYGLNLTDPPLDRQTTLNQVAAPVDGITRTRSTSWLLASPYGTPQKVGPSQPDRFTVILILPLAGGKGASTQCGKTATVHWKGKSVRVRVVDECPVCGSNDIDLSISAFEQLADKGPYALNRDARRLLTVCG
jgi:hypothetical protein